MSEYLYRYQNSGDVVLLHTFPVIRRTPKGAWIHGYGVKPQFVLDGTKKRYAYPTKEEAKASFLARKQRQLGILKAQIKAVEASVQAMNEERIGDYSRSIYLWD